LLLKGHDEVRAAPDPLAAAQMALLRVMHATDLPDPGGLVRQIETLLREGGGAAVAAGAGATAPGAAPVVAQAPVNWADLVNRVDQAHPLVAATMRLAVRVIGLAAGQLVYELAPGIAADPTAEIRRALEAATGEHWQVAREQGTGAPSLEEARVAQAAAQEAAMHEDPLVKAVMAAFPQARIIDDPGSEPGAKPWSRRA